MAWKGQSLQDEFLFNVTGGKKNGTFIEIGSNHPININNTYMLEKEHGWRGIMVEYDPQYLPLYTTIRPTAHHIIQDAQTIDWKKEITNANLPTNIDYLQIDLEVENGSTINTLVEVEKQLMADYKFAVVTFEHDIYRSTAYGTRERSRIIFERNGYFRVFSDVKHSNCPYEDWYVHPDLVDMEYVRKIAREESLEYTDISTIVRNTSRA
jgi:hypothetical protein